MAAEFNGSSYYRANPYYQQAYLPDSAYKNRKPAFSLGELPQGQQYFQPTNKKHFQRLGYYSTIAQDKLMNSDVKRQDFSPIKDKEYFRSLNVADIQGASTNTLISKAVKNRQRAHEELNRRVQEQREAESFEKMRRMERMEDERRSEAMQATIKAEPNYHDLIKRLRTQQKSANKAYQMPQQPKIQKIEQNRANDQLLSKDQMNTYRGQLDQTQNEIKELEQQLSLIREQRSRAQNIYENRPPQQMIANLTPVTYDNKHQINAYLPKHYQPPEQNPEQNLNQAQNYPQSLHNPKNLQEQKNEDRKMINSPSLQGVEKRKQRMNDYRIELAEQKQKKGYPMAALSGRQTREQHRRYNPTFLSYGSASIGLAGQNIVKY